ncbi:hypothetical protein Tco_0400608, partial [Tanacetum coccineum]
MADKGKGIAQSSNEDSLKMIMPIMEQGGSTPNLSILKQFRTYEEGPMTIEEVAFQLQETNRLADLKAVKDKSEEALRSDQLLKTLKAKFKWVATPADKLNIPPSHQLTDFELPLAERKRKRTTEILKEVFISKDVVVDGIHTNLTPPKGITSSNFGQVIEKPEVRILYYNRNFDLVFQRRSEYLLTSTIQLIRIQNLIKIDSEYAHQVYDELIWVIESRFDVVAIREIVEKNLDGMGFDTALASNLRRIQVKDIIKEVEDYLKTCSSARMDIS